MQIVCQPENWKIFSAWDALFNIGFYSIVSRVSKKCLNGNIIENDNLLGPNLLRVMVRVEIKQIVRLVFWKQKLSSINQIMTFWCSDIHDSMALSLTRDINKSFFFVCSLIPVPNYFYLTTLSLNKLEQFKVHFEV